MILDKRWVGKEGVIRFNGDDRSARLCAKKLLNSLCIGTQEGRRHSMKSIDVGDLRLFVTPDKTRKDIRTGISCKKMQNLLEEKYRGPSFEWKRLECQVTSDVSVVAQFIAPTSSDPSWKWNRFMVEKRGIDKVEVEKLSPEAFGSMAQSSGSNHPLPGIAMGRAFGLPSWNLRGLLHHNRALRARKLLLPFQQTSGYASTVVQGPMATLRRFLQDFTIFPKISMHFSGCGQHSRLPIDAGLDEHSTDSGGLLFLLNTEH